MEIMHVGVNFGLRLIITGNIRKYHMGSRTFFDEVVEVNLYILKSH